MTTPRNLEVLHNSAWPLNWERLGPGIPSLADPAEPGDCTTRALPGHCDKKYYCVWPGSLDIGSRFSCWNRRGVPRQLKLFSFR